MQRALEQTLRIVLICHNSDWSDKNYDHDIQHETHVDDDEEQIIDEAHEEDNSNAEDADANKDQESHDG